MIAFLIGWFPSRMIIRSLSVDDIAPWLNRYQGQAHQKWDAAVMSGSRVTLNVLICADRALNCEGDRDCEEGWRHGHSVTYPR
jgi:hypothetical protein